MNDDILIELYCPLPRQAMHKLQIGQNLSNKIRLRINLFTLSSGHENIYYEITKRPKNVYHKTLIYRTLFNYVLLSSRKVQEATKNKLYSNPHVKKTFFKPPGSTGKSQRVFLRNVKINELTTVFHLATRNKCEEGIPYEIRNFK